MLQAAKRSVSLRVVRLGIVTTHTVASQVTGPVAHAPAVRAGFLCGVCSPQPPSGCGYRRVLKVWASVPHSPVRPLLLCLSATVPVSPLDGVGCACGAVAAAFSPASFLMLRPFLVARFLVARRGWSLCPCCSALAAPGLCASCGSPRPAQGGGLGSVLAGFRSVGFSGSRSCRLAVAAGLSAVRLLPVSASVSVGCAAGLDSAVRFAVPGAVVFRAASRLPGALAARSSALVASVAGAGGLLVVCPAAGQACPVGVAPGSAFSGGGSGSWASAALAVQRGGAVLVWAASFPAWLVSAGSSPAPGWWFRPAAQVVQGSLF